MTTTAIKERPILFSGPMVCAILGRRKTQTRRVLKPQPRGDHNGLAWGPKIDSWTGWAYGTEQCGTPHPDWLNHCPYGQRGDRLWVRETIRYSVEHSNFYYAADSRGVGHERFQKLRAICKDRPQVNSIHMPRCASRLTLEVADVRVERLQEITESDAQAEGIRSDLLPACGDHPELICYVSEPDDNYAYPMATEAFAKSWDHLNANRGFSWASNPWVWAVTFKVIEGTA